MPSRKPKELRTRHEKTSRGQTAAVEVVRPNHGSLRKVPAPPKNIEPHIAELWDDFWQSDLAPFVRTTDLQALRRLFVHYDELDKTRDALYADPGPEPVRGVTEGHNDFQMRKREWRIAAQAQGRLATSPRGGLSLNPLLQYMKTLEGSIVALEDRFGFSLRSRQELGLTRLKAQTLAEHNAAQLEALKTIWKEGEAATASDPRAALLKSG